MTGKTKKYQGKTERLKLLLETIGTLGIRKKEAKKSRNFKKEENH